MRHLAIALAGASLVLSTPSIADSGDPLEASAGSVEASAQLAGDLSESGLPVALGAALIVAGSGVALATGDLDYAQEGLELGSSIMDSPYNADGSLLLSDEVIIAAPPPDVPFDLMPPEPAPAEQQPRKGGQ